MRDWHGISYAAVQDAQTRDALATVDDYLAQLSPAIGRLALGRLPDSSGGGIPIDPTALENYLYLPGRAGGQIALGDYIFKTGTTSTDHAITLNPTSITIGRNSIDWLTISNVGVATFSSSTSADTLVTSKLRVGTPSAVGVMTVSTSSTGTSVSFASGALPTGNVSINTSVNASMSLIGNLVLRRQPLSGFTASTPTVQVFAEDFGATHQTGDLMQFLDDTNVLVSRVSVEGYFSSKRLLLTGSTSGVLTHAPAVAGTDYTLTWPAATADGYLKNTAGTLSFDASPAVGAHTHPWGDITGTPTTIAGYGITDLNALGDARWQGLDATLTALAGLNATAGLVEQTGADAFTKRLIGVANATDILTRADGDARYSSVTLDTDLAEIAALANTAGHMLYTNATDNWALLAGPSAANQVMRASAANTFAWGALVAGDIPDLSAVYSPVGHLHTGVYAPVAHSHLDAEIADILTISKISNLTSNGFVKTSAADGTLSVDTSAYLTGNQTITISGDVDGSGTTAITVALDAILTAGGPTGSATAAPSITWDAKGRLTAVSSATITPAVGSITGLGTGVGTWLATPSSANLAVAVTGETGSGALVFGTAPTLTTSLSVNDGVAGSGASSAINLLSSYDASAAKKYIAWRDTGSGLIGRISVYYNGAYASMAFGGLYSSGYQTADLMTLTGTGNFGIGLLPQVAFEALGSARVTVTAAQPYGYRMLNRNSTREWAFGSDSLVVDDGIFYIVDLTAAATPFVITKVTAQTGGLATAGGLVGIGTFAPTARLHVASTEVGMVGIKVLSSSGQTADLQQWQDSAGSTVTSINKDGDLSFTDGSGTGKLYLDGGTLKYLGASGTITTLAVA